MGSTIPSEVIDDEAMYVSERKVYPREIRGRLQILRHSTVYLLLGLYYAMPWLQIEDRQAVLFDLPARKFYMLWLTFWPQDFFFLALLLIMAALSLFFFTAVAGRLWCGYACPQTVWTEVFLWIERWAEGDRAQRMKLDAATTSFNKLRRKGLKYLLWVLFAFWTGLTFVGFFTPIRELLPALWSGSVSGWVLFWLLFYSLATYGNAGVLREQVCKYMCPYARFQSAMFDQNTLIISYDAKRGEARGARKKGSLSSVLQRERGLIGEALANRYVIANAKARHSDDVFISTGLIVDQDETPIATRVDDPQQLGDCIDCTICVQVCPTGIDIRNGLQYECIACGACIDACNDVMDKLDYPKGLIRYTTHNALTGQPVRLLRPRIILYAVLLLALLLGTGIGIAHRKPLLVDVIRDKQLFRVIENGAIENAYQLRLVNKSNAAQTFDVQLQESAGIHLAETPLRIQAEPGQVLTLPVTLRAEAGVVQGRRDIHFVVRTEGRTEAVIEESRFFGPLQ